MYEPQLSLPIIALIPSGIISIAIGIYSWLKIRKRENLIFFIFTITQSAFAFGSVALFNSCGNDNLTTNIDRWILYPFCIFMPILVYHFSYEFCKISAKWQKIILISGYIFTVFLALWSQSKTFIDGVYHYQWGCHTKAQVGNHFYVFDIIFFVLLAIYNFYKVWKDKKKDALKRDQAFYILIGFFIFSLIGFTLFWAYGIGVYPASYLGLPIFVMIIAYAITRYRLMDIKIIFRKSTIYLITISLILSLLYFVILFSSWYTGLQVHWTLVASTFVAAIIMLFLFNIIKDNITKFVNKYFFSEAVDYQEVTNDLVKQLSKEINLKKIVKLIESVLLEKMKITEVKIIFLNRKKTYQTELVRIGFNKETINFLYESFFLKEGIIAVQELNFIKESAKDANIKKNITCLIDDLYKIKASVCLPLFTGENIFGLILLGTKESRDAFTKEDLEALSIFSNQTSISLANALLYKEVQDYSLNLKKKVDEQTHDIKEKTEHLQKLLVMRSEFLNIASHQLRTPVSIIKGVLSMLIEGKVPKDKTKELINSAYDKSLKLNDIINDILGASEMDTDRFVLELAPVDIETIVEEIYAEKKEIADGKGIKLILEKPTNPISQVLSNAKYIKQVIYNLVNNALQYTKEGSITIQIADYEKKIFIKVIDTGIGIPPDSIPNLFQRFNRAPNAVATFADGSGLGLFIIKKIIEGHKDAQIFIEKSELNKGTTFTLALPKI